jgi:hypothetical protein
MGDDKNQNSFDHHPARSASRIASRPLPGATILMLALQSRVISVDSQRATSKEIFHFFHVVRIEEELEREQGRLHK